MSTKSTALAAVTRIPSELPAIAVKNAVVFPVPGMPVPLAVGRGKTLRSIEVAAEAGGLHLRGHPARPR
jgi:hypothetical protein